MNTQKKKNLLKVILASILLLLINNRHVEAQVGIGTTSPTASSVLDLTSTTKGMLTPRMTAAQKTAISSPATGLLIYQTDGSAGFWYYNGSAWTPFTSTGWLTTGNSGTVDGTNFLGTTDDVPFTIKVNNQKAGRIDNTLQNAFFGYRAGDSITTGNYNTIIGHMAGRSCKTGSRNVFIGDSAGYLATAPLWVTAVGYGACYNNTANSTVAFGHRALYANTTGASNTAVGNGALVANTTGGSNTGVGGAALGAMITGSQNTAVGVSALSRNFSGSGSSSFGYQSLFNDTTGTFNSAYGYNSLLQNRNGSYNVAMGTLALESTRGSFNTAIGYGAGRTNTTGSYNTYIGDSANATSIAWSNSTAIGYNAKVGASNSMVLGDSLTLNAVNVGICYPTPTAKLHVNGDILFTPYNNSTSNGAINDYARSGKTVLYFSHASAKTISGFDTPYDGLVLYISNSGGNLILTNNTLSVAANRIITGSGANVTITGDGGATLVYTGSFWRIVSLVQ
ncbi:MAG TPA: hypothetical protein VJY62_21500 [Bacteroidia bacterium]|nr:hypothetical protein [Bacteroidia bacterium]